jgi:hypothetical protein
MLQSAWPLTRKVCHEVWTRPYTLAATLVFVAVSITFLGRQDSEWKNVFVRGAEHLRNGEDIYKPEDAYAYPPFMAWATLPFTLVPPAAERSAWLVVNLIALVLLMRWAWRLSGGQRLEGNAAVPHGEHLAVILGLLCGAPYLENCLAHQQADIVMGALLLGGCTLLTQDRSLKAATCFGVAAAMKCTPLLWVPYLIWRRRPAAAAWLVCVALGVNWLPDLVSHPASGRTWLAEYRVRYLQGLTAADHYLGTWSSEVTYNQSLAGASQRWLVTEWSWAADDVFVNRRPNPASPGTLRRWVYTVEALLLLGALWAARRPFQKTEPAPAGQVGPQALEYSVVLLLMLLLSPMSSKAHFGVLVLPGFCLARAARITRDRRTWTLVLTAAALGVLGSKDLLGERLYTLALWYGSATWQTLLLLAGCYALLRRSGPTSVPVVEEERVAAEWRQAA